MKNSKSGLDVLNSILADPDPKEQSLQDSIHPQLGTLHAYLTDKLDASKSEEVQAHLVRCKSCAQTLLELQELVHPPTLSSSEAVDLEVAASWRDFQAKRTRQNKLFSVFRGYQRFALASAAVLAVILIGSLSWQVTSLNRSVGHLKQRISAINQVNVNPPILYLDDTTRSNDSQPLLLDIVQTATVIVMVYTPENPFKNYSVALTGLADNTRQEWHNLKLANHETLTLLVPSSTLSSGTYHVTISGADDDVLTELETYRINVTKMR